MGIEYTNSPQNITDGNKKNQHFPIIGTPKTIKCGMKINYLATLRQRG
jgi:hypothetical protein